MPETLQSLTNLPISILGFGLFAALTVPFAGWLRKHLNMLSTQVWMILFAAVMCIVMLVMLLLPPHRKAKNFVL